jgi:transcriptional regulator with PAS, ATPase and Fis domain
VLFLDEIGEMDLALQAKVLRVLQEGRVLSLGDDDEVAVDVRVIAATNRNLEEMVANKTFRADLFHRLTILSMRIPPIRERRDDLGALVEHFVSNTGTSSGRRLRASARTSWPPWHRPNWPATPVKWKTSSATLSCTAKASRR